MVGRCGQSSWQVLRFPFQVRRFDQCLQFRSEIAGLLGQRWFWLYTVRYTSEAEPIQPRRKQGRWHRSTEWFPLLRSREANSLGSNDPRLSDIEPSTTAWLANARCAYKHPPAAVLWDDTQKSAKVVSTCILMLTRIYLIGDILGLLWWSETNSFSPCIRHLKIMALLPLNGWRD